MALPGYDQVFGNSPKMADLAPTIQTVAAQYGIPAELLAAVIAHESAMGTSRAINELNNPGGVMNPSTNWMTLQSFPTIQAGLEATARAVAANYARGGNSVEGMGRIYAPPGAANDPRGLNGGWAQGVNYFINQLGGGQPLSAAAQPSAPSVNPSPGSLNIPDMMGVLPPPTSGLYALGGLPEGAARFDTPPVNAQPSGLSLEQITAMLGDLPGGFGLLPSDGTQLPAQPEGNYFYPPEMPPGQAYFGPGVENPDNYHYPPEQPQGQAYFGPDATPDAQPQQATGFLPIPAYSGSYAGAGGFQPSDVPSFPDLGGHVDQVASGYDPTNPPSHDSTDTSNLTAWMPAIFGGNKPGANATPAEYPGSGNWRNPDTGAYAFGSDALSAFADAAAGKSTEKGSAGIPFSDATAAGKAVYDASSLYAPDSHIADLDKLNKEIEQGQKVAQAAQDPIWGTFANMASDVGGMFAPFAMGSGTPPPNAYAETPPTNPYEGKEDPKTALDAVNWMGQGGLGLTNDPAALQFGGFSGGMGDAFDPNADPFAKKEEKAPQQPSYTSPISSTFGIPQGGWASFGAGTLAGQPWSMGSALPIPSLLPAPVAQKTREFVPQPMSYAPQPAQSSAPIMIAPPANPYAPPPGMDPNYGGIFQVPGMGPANGYGPSFDPGSFSDQDAEALASAMTAQDQTGAKTALCSYFMRKGRISKEIWKAETRYSYRFSPLMRNGYHTWAKPCVRAMERGGVLGSVLGFLLFPVASTWAKEMAFRMGVGERGSKLGSMFHVILGGLSTALGWLIQPNDLPQEDF